MYHKFHLHFPSSQITFYPIRCLLSLLIKRHSPAAVLQPPLHRSPTNISSMFFSLQSHVHSVCPLLGHSYLPCNFSSVFSRRLHTPVFDRQQKSCNTNLLKAFFFFCYFPFVQLCFTQAPKIIHVCYVPEMWI